MENFILKKMVVTDIIVLFASMMWIFSSSDVYALRSDWKSFIHSDMVKQYMGKDLGFQYSSEKFEGDMEGIDAQAPTNELTVQAKNVMDDQKVRWENGTVPYQLSESFRPEEKDLIKRAMKAISILTFNCVKFKEHTNEPDYVHLLRGVSCSSSVGRQAGMQTISLARGCMDFLGDIQHELMHALGFFHEVSRFDRDQYVLINWDNIDKSNQKQFQMYSEGNTFGLPYDYESVMHYPFTAFAVDKTLPTLVPKTRHARIGQNKNLSPLDVAKIQVAYRCGPVDVSSLDIEPLSTSTESVRAAAPTDSAVSPLIPGGPLTCIITGERCSLDGSSYCCSGFCNQGAQVTSGMCQEKVPTCLTKDAACDWRAPTGLYCCSGMCLSLIGSSMGKCK